MPEQFCGAFMSVTKRQRHLQVGAIITPGCLATSHPDTTLQGQQHKRIFADEQMKKSQTPQTLVCTIVAGLKARSTWVLSEVWQSLLLLKAQKHTTMQSSL